MVPKRYREDWYEFRGEYQHPLTAEQSKEIQDKLQEFINTKIKK